MRTMETAGRAVVFSGMRGRARPRVLLVMPLPFMRMMGVAGFLIPIVSIVAAVTLQPALLSFYGRRGTARWPAAAFLATGCTCRSRDSGTVDGTGLLGAARARDHGRAGRVPRRSARRAWSCSRSRRSGSRSRPARPSGIPRTPQSVRGFDVLKQAVGAGRGRALADRVDAGAGRHVLDAGGRSRRSVD